MGQRVDVDVRPLESGVDLDELRAGARLSHVERLREAASWNRVTSRLEIAAAARRG